MKSKRWQFYRNFAESMTAAAVITLGAVYFIAGEPITAAMVQQVSIYLAVAAAIGVGLGFLAR